MKSQLSLYQKLAIISGGLLVTVCLFLLSEQSADQTKADIDEDYPVWIDMMEQPSVEMEEAREAFDNYWENHQHFKGDRSKQFEQWYAINSNRLDQFGKLISAAQVSSEFQKLRKQAGAEQQGEWYNYGPINVGPRNGTKRDGGRVKDIEFHPTDKNTFLVSTFKGGLFKTTDYGQSWSPLTDGLTEQVYVSEVSNDDPNNIFIGTDLGVYKSDDGGQNWSNTSVSVTTKALLLKSDNQNIILAGSENGIWRSIDGGANWTLVKSASNVEDLDSHPTNPEIIYATTNGNPSEFFRSEDGGQNWTKNTTFGQGCFMGAAVSPAQPDYVYVINLRDHLGEDSFEGFYFSEDSGMTFTKQSGYSPCISGYKNDGAISRGQPNYNLFVCADPVNADVVYAGGVRSWKSIDKGKTWTHFYEDITTDGDNLHLDQLNWAFSPHDNRIFAVNDGGVYFLNEEDKFQMITDGLPIAEIYECTQSQTVKTNVAGGTMHCGVKLNYNGVWITPWGGDEATCIIDPTDEKYVYHLKYEKISRSIDGGQSFQRINSSSADRGHYTGTGALHKSDPNTLFVGLLEVERTNNARASAVNWQKISSFGGDTKIQKVEQCSANYDILYVARGSSFFRSENVNASNPTFSDITSNLPSSGSVNDIASHPSDANMVYILLGSKIYKSTDKGLNWTDISFNLPAVALLEMTYDNSSTEGIYVGTDIGVFYKDDSMDSWVDFSKNLPAIRVSGMDIYYGENRDDSFITISTDGRGFWRSTLYGVILQAPVADFSVERDEIIVGGVAKYYGAEAQLATYNWEFEGGTPATSIDINPEIKYDEPGTYSVKLSISNTAGLEEKTKTGYITVKDASELGTLQLHYSFDGEFKDISPFLRDPEINGNVKLENNDFAIFDGSSYLNVKSYKGITGTADRSVTAWIKTSTANTSIVAWGTATTSQKLNFRTETTGELRFEIGGGYVVGSKNVCDNQWHHVAFSFENDGTPDVSDVKMYVDGEVDAFSVNSPVSLNTAVGDDVEIGNDQMGRKFIGLMDDVRIYSEALSQEKIQEIKNSVKTNAEFIQGKELKIYSGRASVIIENAKYHEGKILVFDVLGRKIKSGELVFGRQQLEISKGTYIVCLETKDGCFSEKAISF